MSSIGGIITLPIAIPVGLTASLYIQMRMVAGIATISGYNQVTGLKCYYENGQYIEGTELVTGLFFRIARRDRHFFS